MHKSWKLRLFGLFGSLALSLPLVAGCGGKAAPSTAEPEPAPAPDDTAAVTDDGERVHAAAQVRFRVPASWNVDESDPGILTMTSPDDTVGLSLLVVDAADLDAALAQVAAGVLEELHDVTFDGEADLVELNGMPAGFVDGHAVVEGAPVELGIGAVQTPTGKYLLMIGMADEGTLAAHEPAVMSVLESIQPL